ncbi:MAG: polyribonucleotide nucleotidyltransferase [Ignavibacteriales bacterium CG07_land_8_20_14_0_80_59_12]|nr:MAG: polyribonucleotide nucleotidyltransferase [Ignavibacteriales bacterium CG07_land_8_20_14_0_80_59_12]
MVQTKTLEIGGRILTLETGKLGKQAGGAVMVRYGDTIVFVTVVTSKEPVERRDFLPLSVDYREKTSAAGKIPGGFFKREGRPTEKEVLSARLIDRPIRPLFPKTWCYETQVIATVFSSDQENDSDILGAIGGSAALMISDVPFDGPVSEVRVGRVNGELVINPTFSQLQQSDMDITVAGSADSIVMVEGEGKEISEADMVEALKFARGYLRQICDLQNELRAEAGRPKRAVPPATVDESLVADVKALAATRIHDLTHSPLKKEERILRTQALADEVQAALAEKYPERAHGIAAILHDIEKEDMRAMILSEGRRLDGRGLTEVRPISIEVGLLPRTHGSALFTRGETQSLSTATLGTKLDEQRIDGLLPDMTKRFMLHYNFPPFSVGEVRRIGSPGRREIGHGNLAERSLKNMLPPEVEFPYTIRIVSDILESNGSSSMATVCAGTLALMDGGVPLRKPVAGIAMGLVKEEEHYAVLTDILGNEDHLGDMDFKVAGTSDGITAFQMDIKIKGISFEIMSTALEQALAGRLHILGIMNAALPEPRAELSPYAPRLTTIQIPIDMIGAVIGPGGKTIRAITAESGAEINIEDDGRIIIASTSKEASDKARQAIERIVEVPEMGKVYKATVRRIADFGAFVEILPGKDALLHISQIDVNRVEKVSDVLKVGDEIEVKIVKIDEDGKIGVSRKAILAPDQSGEGDGQQRRPSSHGRPRPHEGGPRRERH